MNGSRIVFVATAVAGLPPPVVPAIMVFQPSRPRKAEAGAR